MRKMPPEHRRVTVSTTLQLKHIDQLESHARAHGLTVSEFIRAAIQQQYAPEGSQYLIIKDISPELLAALEAQAEKLGKDIAAAAKELLQNACSPVAQE